MTTIEAGETKERRGFGWIETFRILERKTTGGKKVMAACEITLNDWMFRAIVKDRRVLTINPGYFRLTHGPRSAGSTSWPGSIAATRSAG